MSAWCQCGAPVEDGSIWGDAHGVCRLDRSCRENQIGEHRGRPLGLLVAWLRMGHGRTSRQSHFMGAKDMPQVMRLQANLFRTFGNMHGRQSVIVMPEI